MSLARQWSPQATIVSMKLFYVAGLFVAGVLPISAPAPLLHSVQIMGGTDYDANQIHNP
jgi:hypothetical protein